MRRARHRPGPGRLHGRRPARPGGDARGRVERGAGQCASLDRRTRALDHHAPAVARRRARTVRLAAGCAGPYRRMLAEGTRMSWRMVLGLVLLAAALLSGWSAWKQRDVPEADAPSTERSDYLMRDFEMISLDDQGQESMTLRAPEMQRNPKDETFQITTPLFLLPDTDGNHWEMRSKTAWVSAKGDEIRLSGQVNGKSPQDAASATTFETERLNVFPARTSPSPTMRSPSPAPVLYSPALVSRPTPRPSSTPQVAGQVTL